MSAAETYRIAHTARCKLQMAADRPDRDLRFILGHAFTLDKLMLRVVEIESGSSSSDDEDTSPTDDFSAPTCKGSGHEHKRRVSFNNDNVRPHNLASNTRAKSPPPNEEARLDDGDGTSSDEDYAEDDEEEEGDDGLGLRRFASAATQPPRMIEDEEGSSSDEDEPKSPPPISEAELREITVGKVDEGLVDLYQGIKRCPCHGHHESGPTIEKAWEVPQNEGFQGKRMAVVQVAA